MWDKINFLAFKKRNSKLHKESGVQGVPLESRHQNYLDFELQATALSYFIFYTYKDSNF